MDWNGKNMDFTVQKWIVMWKNGFDEILCFLKKWKSNDFRNLKAQITN